MSIKNIFKKITRMSRKHIVAIAAGVALAIPVVVFAGYGPNGPDRVIYDFSNPAQREGAFDGPRFNSYINTNVYGDERAFVDTKECVAIGNACYEQGTSGGFSDQQTVTVGKEYLVRVYVHNIANPSINDNPATPAPMDGIGVAKNTRVRFELPAGSANGFTAQARIMADNSLPKTVYDTVDFKNNNQKFNVDYIPGSARIYNGAHSGGLTLSDDIMSTNGTLIGYDAMNGVYPGCFEYSAFVVVRVKIKAPDLEIDKRVSKVDMPKLTDSVETLHVKRGETVSWRIDYKNNGSDVAGAVTIRDELPAGLKIVPGSVKLSTAVGTEVLPDTALGAGGVNVGDYAPNGNGVIRFRTVVDTADKVCDLKNVAFGRAKDISERSDDAKIIIDDCQPDVPIYRCDTLTATIVKDRQVKFDVKYTAQPKDRVKLKTVEYSYGDGNKLMTDKTSVDYTYAKDGKYTAEAKLSFMVDGKQKVAKDVCVASINFSTTTTTTTTTPGGKLPSTGPGDVVGVFVAATIAGTLAHKFVVTRRYQ